LQEPAENRLERAEALLGHHFADSALLQRALTHPSYAEEAGLDGDYERLEFLGDAVLGLIVVGEIYRSYPHLPEGVMTKMKISAVAGSTLSEVAEELGIADLILLGSSERGTGRRGMTSALENAFEALVGALYLDAGLDAARRFVLGQLGDRIAPGLAEDLEHPKSRLQELLQASGKVPVYTIATVEGPPHDRRFEAHVTVDGRLLGAGAGVSKKEAEMNAAAEALTRIAAG
jgi:ribonuclease-3